MHFLSISHSLSSLMTQFTQFSIFFVFAFSTSFFLMCPAVFCCHEK